jgi:hypothetical protein
MSVGSRFTGKVGLDDDFFDTDKVAHLAVEAPIEGVAGALEGAADYFRPKRAHRPRVLRDVLGAACSEEWPLAVVFQLRGSQWTQLGGDIRRLRALPLGRHLSRILETRCLCIEVTDDAYQSHALFDRGATEELSLLTMNVDVGRVLTELGLEVPSEFAGLDPDDLDLLEEAEYAYRREGTPATDPGGLVAREGCYLRTPSFGEAVYGVPGLQAEDLVRMDAIALEPAG